MTVAVGLPRRAIHRLRVASCSLRSTRQRACGRELRNRPRMRPIACSRPKKSAAGWNISWRRWRICSGGHSACSFSQGWNCFSKWFLFFSDSTACALGWHSFAAVALERRTSCIGFGEESALLLSDFACSRRYFKHLATRAARLVSGSRCVVCKKGGETSLWQRDAASLAVWENRTLFLLHPDPFLGTVHQAFRAPCLLPL